MSRADSLLAVLKSKTTPASNLSGLIPAGTFIFCTCRRAYKPTLAARFLSGCARQDVRSSLQVR